MDLHLIQYNCLKHSPGLHALMCESTLEKPGSLEAWEKLEKVSSI